MDRPFAPVSHSRIAQVLAAAILYTVLFILHLRMSGRFDPPILFGDRSKAVFDLWSFQHLCSGILIGALLSCAGIVRKRAHHELVITMFLIALCWEAVEMSMEAGCFGQSVAAWKCGHEHWTNRFVGDIGLVTLGGLTAQRFAWAWKIVLLPCLAWLIANIAAHDSMTINRLVFGP